MKLPEWINTRRICATEDGYDDPADLVDAVSGEDVARFYQPNRERNVTLAIAGLEAIRLLEQLVQWDDYEENPRDRYAANPLKAWRIAADARELLAKLQKEIGNE